MHSSAEENLLCERTGSLMTPTDHHRLIFANTVNEVMTSAPSEAYARSLASVTPRKMWLAREGDVIITPRPIPIAFKEYVCSTLGIRTEAVTTLCPGGDLAEPLAHAVRRTGMIDDIRQLCTRSLLRMLCFAPDYPTVALACELGIPMEHYEHIPSPEVLARIYDLNTKSGFRRAMKALGIRTVPGAYCNGLEELTDSVLSLFEAHNSVIVKLDRSSNGYGHTVIRRDELGSTARSSLAARLKSVDSQCQEFTVEAFLGFTSVPSVELVIEQTGPRLLYVCDQRCRHRSFTGMVTPPTSLPLHVSEQLLDIGLAFGGWLFDAGIRGVFDVDGGLTHDGILYVTETNLRRTGGTYLDTLVRRLVGLDYLKTHVWIADARSGTLPMDFLQGWSLVQKARLDFQAQPGVGVLLTSDTLDWDGKWRYLIIAQDIGMANEIETNLEHALGLAPID
jgi:hypothetical protein